MRNDIKDWAKKCAHCCAYNICCNKKSELYLLWLDNTPVYIMKVNLGIPGKLMDEKGRSLKSMNRMRGLTQFVILIIVKDTKSANFAILFMKQVVLSFDILALVVVDADSKFLLIYKEICAALDIKFWPLSRGNHKGMIVEHYHRLLNKT